MPSLREVATQALEAMEKATRFMSDSDYRKLNQAITALRAALAEPVQEPVAWTPVAEALPKSGVKVLACYRNRLGNLRRIRAMWTAAKTEEADSEDADACSEYDEATDTYYVTEGWYECIDNWGDYSSVAVTEGEVTHWMPLPPDPDAAQPRRPAEPVQDHFPDATKMVQEPVAYIHRQGNHFEVSERHLDEDEKARGWTEEPLYAAPPQRKPLAEWQINDLMADIDPEDRDSWSFRQGVYAAEKHHGVRP